MKTKTLKTRIKIMEDIKNAINMFGDDYSNAETVSGIYNSNEELGFETAKYYFNKEGKVVGVKNAIVLKNGYRIIFDEEDMIVYNKNYGIDTIRDYDNYNVTDLSIIAYQVSLRKEAK